MNEMIITDDARMIAQFIITMINRNDNAFDDAFDECEFMIANDAIGDDELISDLIIESFIESYISANESNDDALIREFIDLTHLHYDAIAYLIRDAFKYELIKYDE